MKPEEKNPAGCVLVIDDEALVRRGTARLLRTFGWTVIEAESPADLDGIFREHPEIEVVLSDLDMPDGGGERVVAEAPVPVVILSGNGRCSQVGAAEWLMKPARAEEIEWALRSALAGGES